jgi:hypothetical protein
MFLWSNVAIILIFMTILGLGIHLVDNKEKLKYKIKLLKMECRYHKRILTHKDISMKIKIKHIFCMIFRRCPRKGSGCEGGYAYLKHSNCAYVNELSNYNFCCKNCHDEIDAMYQGWWDEHNASRL